MKYDTIVARSFSKHDQKRLGVGAFVGCLVIAFCFCTVFKPHLDPLPLLKLQFSFGVHLKMLMTEETIQPQEMEIKTKEVKQICDFSDTWTNICEMNGGDIRIHGNSSTIFVPPTQMIDISTENISYNIKPYARKRDSIAMGRVNEFTITTSPPSPSHEFPQCTQNHSIPAIVFSIGGYAGNHFHDFTDVVIPLYLTSRQFNGEVQFLVSDKQTYWINKYQTILKNLSKYEIIDIDRDDNVHCFPTMIVGLKHHKELSIDPSKSPYSMKDFREFLRNSFSLKRETAINNNKGKKPRLLIVTRKRTRAFVNEPEIADMARSLGFETVATEADSSLRRFSEVVNSCDVMMGVHGAGLTNSIFLPENAVLIQIVPLGGMEWLAKTDFGEPAKDMNLRYLEYSISINESTLIQQYPTDHPIFTGSDSIYQKGWRAFRSVYLDKQNVKLDLTRFQATLLQALNLLQM